MDTKPKITLAELSRQPLHIGNPPLFLFNDDGQRCDRDLINLSVQLRIAEALEALVQLKMEGEGRNG